MEINEKAMKELVEKEKDDLFEKLSTLIKIDSQNFGSHGNEQEIARFLAGEMKKLGYEPEVYSPLDVEGITEHPDYYGGRHLEDRFNMSVVIPGSDHSRRLMIAAHNDTETVGALSNWTVKPFGGEIKDGKIWGRGACDDKYGIAAAWFLWDLFRKNGIVLPYDIVFTAYCDEEGGGGNGTLAACLKYPVDDAINLDCKNMEIWAGGAGGGCLNASFVTREPVDNCEKLTDAIQIYREEMDVFRKRRHDELMQHPMFAESIIPDTAVRFQSVKIGADLSLNGASAGLCFYTSSSEDEIRKELDEIAENLTRRLDPLDILFNGFRLTTRFFHFAETEENNPVRDQLSRSVYEISGRERKGIGSCLSDLPLFIHHASPRAVCFGVGRDFGEYGGAHQPDEFLECDEMLIFTQVLADFLLHYAQLPRG